jgi:hypothetical protein
MNYIDINGAFSTPSQGGDLQSSLNEFYDALDRLNERISKSFIIPSDILEGVSDPITSRFEILDL